MQDPPLHNTFLRAAAAQEASLSYEQRCRRGGAILMRVRRTSVALGTPHGQQWQDKYGLLSWYSIHAINSVEPRRMWNHWDAGWKSHTVVPVRKSHGVTSGHRRLRPRAQASGSWTRNQCAMTSVLRTEQMLPVSGVLFTIRYCQQCVFGWTWDPWRQGCSA
jgi:hypothetical protein